MREININVLQINGLLGFTVHDRMPQATVNGTVHPLAPVPISTGPPKAMVKPQVLTHVIEGFVIHEGKVIGIHCIEQRLNVIGYKVTVVYIQYYNYKIGMSLKSRKK